MGNYRFKKTGNHWRAQKKKWIFFWEDIYISNLLIEVKDINLAYHTLESHFGIKIGGVIYSAKKDIADIVYRKV